MHLLHTLWCPFWLNFGKAADKAAEGYVGSQDKSALVDASTGLERQVEDAGGANEAKTKQTDRNSGKHPRVDQNEGAHGPHSLTRWRCRIVCFCRISTYCIHLEVPTSRFLMSQSCMCFSKSCYLFGITSKLAMVVAMAMILRQAVGKAVLHDTGALVN